MAYFRYATARKANQGKNVDTVSAFRRAGYTFNWVGTSERRGINKNPVRRGANMKSVVSAVAVATALASGVSAFVTPSSRTTSTDASQLAVPPADEKYIPVDSTRASYYPFGASTSSDRLISLSARPPKSNEEVTDGSANVRQLLGLKGASETTDIWKTSPSIDEASNVDPSRLGRHVWRSCVWQLSLDLEPI
ncbi:hypothetical protein THAOC_25197 [Thalassiosira oceanica]|uniref:Uncharacterized protein n=1 Tax=Thalassiosira oceanica TaxID=159749 RepID=K0RMX7_THAOC|nr:hypothetical protein THAOC_25197 [Thalassiosira oceanica]|eukprot:EJK55103.1 hypothetical protein THAOC_25197 [Thalassiosira oceanica]